jgi:hypothetical protein
MLEVKNEKTENVSEEVLIISMEQARISEDEKSKNEENVNSDLKKSLPFNLLCDALALCKQFLCFNTLKYLKDCY